MYLLSASVLGGGTYMYEGILNRKSAVRGSIIDYYVLTIRFYEVFFKGGAVFPQAKEL